MNKDKQTILIVDDEKTNVQFLNDKLKSLYNIKTANNGKTALKILSKFEIDLVLLDIVMPQMDGYETLEKIRKDLKLITTPVIFLTAKDDADSLRKAFELGANDYITKPFDNHELKLRVNNHLEIYELNKTIKNEKEKFQLLLKNTQDGTHIFDDKGNIILSSDYFSKMLDYTNDEMLNLTIKDIDKNFSENNDFDLSLYLKLPKTYETIYIKKDNTRINVLVNTIPIELDEKFYIYASSKDITHLMKQTQELSEHKAELEAQNSELIKKEEELIHATGELEILFEDAPVSYYLINKKFDIIRQNITSMRHFKKPLNNMFGTILSKKSFYDLIIYLDHCDSNSDGIDIEIKNKYNHYHHAKLYANKNPINETQYIVAVSDIEKDYMLVQEREKNYLLDKQLIEQSKLAQMGEMVGNIAHQWRQPLSVISVAATGSLCELDTESLTKENFRSNLELINQQSQYLSKTIDIFRNFLLERKEKQKVILQSRIKTAIEIVDMNLKNNKIELVSNIDDIEPIEFELVVGELTQVIINMINNAKDALKEKSTQNSSDKRIIKVHLSKDINYIYISIEDNGGGIDEEIINRVFEPYFTTKHQSQGTGLGLYMSHQIITESFNGRILVSNTEVGAKFTIILPIINE